MEPVQIDSVQNLLLQVSRQLQSHGWALMCTSYAGHPYQFTVGLSLRFDHPELEVIGLTPELGQSLLERLVDKVKRGERLSAGEFFSGLLEGFDLFLVDNPADPDGPAVIGNRLRLIWPDAKGRFPWHPDCDPYCTSQSLLLEPEGLDIEGLQRMMANSKAIV